MIREAPMEVKIIVMQHMKTVADTIGDEDFDKLIVPSII